MDCSPPVFSVHGILQSEYWKGMLPKKFTIRQLQNLLEAVFGIEIDNRNFRKKIFTTGILQETDEMERNVNHKPARLYMLNKSAFGRKDLVHKLNFVASWLK